MNQPVDVSVRPPFDPVYLGDGVYASFDGYHICLTTGSHDAGTLIWLEPSVLCSLIEYGRRVGIVE